MTAVAEPVRSFLPRQQNPCVYVATDSTGQIKIGVSASLPRRLYQLSRARGEAVTLVARFDVPTMRMARSIEASAHRAFDAAALGEEWFSCSGSDAVGFIAPLCPSPDEPAAKPPLCDDARLLRAARRMLGWTMEDLALKAGVSHVTVKNIERGSTDPKGSTVRRLRSALQDAGLTFLDTGDTKPGGKGVRFR